MATFTYKTTLTTLAGGVDGVAGKGPTFRVTFGGTWANGDTYQFDIVTAAQTFQLGSSDITKKVPTALLTNDQKLNFVAGQDWFFSAVGDSTGFNQQDTGAGSIELSSRTAEPEDQVAIVNYQGMVAVFARDTIQIWQVDADPTLYNLFQILSNIGTMASLSVQPLGDLDVMFLSDTGLRSLRSRETVLNATTVDIGTPVDSLVQADLRTVSATDAAAACAVVEPSSGRYWCYLNGHLYVLSYFPTSKIVAWSQYSCTYYDNGTQYTFVPEKFVIFQGQVYVLANSSKGTKVVLQYGGSDNNTYDATVAQFSTQWVDAKKPGHVKYANAIDASMSGAWTLKFGSDYIDEEAYTVINTSTPTFDQGNIPVQGRGTHFRMQASTTGSEAAVFSSALLHFTEEDEK